MSAVRKMSSVHVNMYRKSGPIKSQQHTYQKKISMMTPRDNMLILLGKSHRAHHCLEISGNYLLITEGESVFYWDNHYDRLFGTKR